MIEGVIITPLRRIPDERGTIMHMMRNDSQVFTKFGEIYFSTVYPGVIKAWHIHDIMTLNYYVVSGTIKFVLYDERENSATKGELMELYPGENNFSMITVPPGVWNGFMGIGTKEAIVANLTDIPHDPNEIHRADPLNNHIPYSWPLKHR
jgi:dTDP-4-dehydrorhamnose 3,5-epimerase